MKWALSAALAAALAIAVPAFAASDDLCRDPVQLQNPAFRQACSELAQADRNLADVKGVTHGLQIAGALTEQALAPSLPGTAFDGSTCFSPKDPAIKARCQLLLFLYGLNARTLPFRGL